MRNVLRLTAYMCIIPCTGISKLSMITKWSPTPNQLDIRGKVDTLPTLYGVPAPTYSPHHHLSPSRASTVPNTLTHDIDVDTHSIHHCDSESLLYLSDSPSTKSSHSDEHSEAKYIVCHLVSRMKAGLSCNKCHNYFHLFCIKPKKLLCCMDASVLVLLRLTSLNCGILIQTNLPSLVLLAMNPSWFLLMIQTQLCIPVEIVM